ncbi:cysteine sulfinic acid decarboxylase-like [Macrosteles quadrilineatus]|uniref:cysteine sulfinic acid decarboxylase-like n=1 Tax=Macrosteles quadrilineatus TaxID=74068 RepID=UPI0023E322FF|nr:cysteine sulfinic acid decarboxylase-like [Macrosteles quadrilineatus]
MAEAGCNGLNYSRVDTLLLQQVLNILQEESVLETGPNDAVVNFQHPFKLKESWIFQELGVAASTEEKLVEAMREVIQHSVKTHHPLFLNQLYGGTDPYGLAAAWLTEALNTNQHTFEVAPVFTIIERSVIGRLLYQLGYEDGDGIFTAGGSMANMYAMVLARYKTCPEVKKQGLWSCCPLAVFVSSESHYSFLKAAHWLGLGLDSVYEVACDREGRMLPDALHTKVREAVDQGKLPFFVNATAGTTVLGAFDPFNAIADICEKFNIWFHIDACWGGAVMFSKKYNYLLQGAERSDSIAWNPHKMLGAPLQCSVILLKNKDLLHQCNSSGATYLFQQDKFYDTSYDLGDKSVQCGRKPDSFKLWLMWRARGDAGFGLLVDKAMELSKYFLKMITSIEEFRLVLPEFQFTNICFWYIPKCLQSLPETEEWWDRVGKVAPLIKEKIVLKGSLMIAYQPLKQRKLPNFFRLVLTCHPEHTECDLDRVIEEITIAGNNIQV